MPNRSANKKTSHDPVATTPERSALFGKVRQKGTEPETIVREMLMRLGHAHSTNVRSMPGSPDIVAADRSKAVFVHGCYWHRHPGCRATTTPTQNAEFWKEKFATNVRRDRRKVRELRKLGVQVMTVWECQTKSAARRSRLERRLDRFFRTSR